MRRLLELTLGDPYSNVAFEEAMLSKAEEPTLRVWENQRSVVIGRAQAAEWETDLAYCNRSGVPVVRRVSAGGAVYNGPGNLNWTFVVPGGRRFDAKGVFEEFSQQVVGALGACGVECWFEPPNSLVAMGGKVSGLAAYLSKGRTLCHGTLLFDADLEEVASLTKPSRRKLPRRYTRSRFAKVANCGVDPREFVRALAGAGSYERGEASREELAHAEQLLGKYRSREWNLGDPFA